VEVGTACHAWQSHIYIGPSDYLVGERPVAAEVLTHLDGSWTVRETWLKGRSPHKRSWSFPFIPFPSYWMSPVRLPGAVKGAAVLRGEANP